MRDTIYRDEAIEAVGEWMQKEFGFLDLNRAERLIDALSALPSAEAEPTVIRSRTLMPTKDFKEWARRIREVNPNAVVIPCDAEVVSAEAEEHRIYKDGYNTGKAHASAEAVQGWIPCSERLPDDDGDYLVWLEDESDHYAVVYFDTGADAFGWWVDHYDPITLGFIESDFCEAKNITAWQPLPTPYKGGDDK